ncbi:HAD family phosphatase [Granulicella sp. S156]|jgi:putative hydrolase of the HAD superfamily|uniref:HAD family hydrolase n=1 Tax=Granulicella sp. S156 TaxID=1747224 RepID=UPI00131B0846|nr:HAD family phosphatase [Granulicella sp. S156]
MSSTVPTINAVLFDFGMVLTTPPDPASWERLKAVFSADEASFHKAYWKHRDDYDRGTLKSHSYWLEVANDLHKPLGPEALRELIAADIALWTQPNQVMIDWAANLQRAGIKTGILSNMPDAMEVGIRDTFAWIENFDHHTWSHRLLLAKPEAAIYRHAAEGLALPPAEILFIDDREENIEAAVAVGMQAIQYTNHDTFVQEMNEREFGPLLNPVGKNRQ